MALDPRDGFLWSQEDIDTGIDPRDPHLLSQEDHDAGAAAYEMNAEAGSYAVAGVAATPAYGRVFDAAPDSYAVSGAAATVAPGWVFEAGTGSYLLDWPPHIEGSYSESNKSSGTGIRGDGVQTQVAQSFLVGSEVVRLVSADFYLARDDNPPGNAYAHLYAHTGSFGTTSKPTGSPLATSDPVVAASMSDFPTYGLVRFEFSGAQRVSLQAGTHYCIAVEYSAGSGSNIIYVGRDSTSPTHAGNDSRYFDAQWDVEPNDLCFYVRATYETRLIADRLLEAAPDSYAVTGQPTTNLRDLIFNAERGRYLVDRLFQEGFEGVGYEEEGWVEGGTGTIDPDVLTSGVTGTPANWGARCLEVVTAAEIAQVVYTLDAVENVVHAHHEFIIGSTVDNTSTMAIGRLNFDAGWWQRCAEWGRNKNGYFEFIVAHSGGGQTYRGHPDNPSTEYLYMATDTLYVVDVWWDLDNEEWEVWINGESFGSGAITGTGLTYTAHSLWVYQFPTTDTATVYHDRMFVSKNMTRLVASRLFDAGPGAYAITGADATLVYDAGAADFPMNAEPGVYGITGVLAALTSGKVLDAGPGGYTVTGVPATVVVGRAIDAAAGGYSITGSDAELLRGLVLNAETGVYSVSGVAANLITALLFNAESGVYGVTGAPATTARGLFIDAEAGGYTVSGTPITTLVDRLLNAESGAYAITGIAITVIRDYAFDANAGGYVITGVPATLVFNPIAGQYVLVADPGSYTLTGADIEAIRSFVSGGMLGRAFTGRQFSS